MRSRRDHKTILATVTAPRLAGGKRLLEAVWTRAQSLCEAPGCGRWLFRPGTSKDHASTGYVYSPEMPMIDPAKARLLCGPHFKMRRP